MAIERDPFTTPPRKRERRPSAASTDSGPLRKSAKLVHNAVGGMSRLFSRRAAARGRRSDAAEREPLNRAQQSPVQLDDDADMQSPPDSSPSSLAISTNSPRRHSMEDLHSSPTHVRLVTPRRASLENLPSLENMPGYEGTPGHASSRYSPVTTPARPTRATPDSSPLAPELTNSAKKRRSQAKVVRRLGEAKAADHVRTEMRKARASWDPDTLPPFSFKGL
ncbi:uncharacterized protein SCHCODRAFT_02605136 [Schizophyllum commune H4-8]|nr:uncharacterized protein SCHCODRAFT_02605136 [Schizophyllum commune H4-8]KAI5899439.1 hypothetical protein SCHCODRAFT_02605136 [Schizophyllum commune H4-8]